MWPQARAAQGHGIKPPGTVIYIIFVYQVMSANILVYYIPSMSFLLFCSEINLVS